MALRSDKQEINRRENARALADECGSKAAFADRIERSAGQVGHYIGKTPTKNIGKDMARHIEKCFSKPSGWLDIDHASFGEAASIFAALPDQEKRTALRLMKALLDQSADSKE